MLFPVTKGKSNSDAVSIRQRDPSRFGPISNAARSPWGLVAGVCTDPSLSLIYLFESFAVEQAPCNSLSAHVFGSTESKPNKASDTNNAYESG
jgi:hypothetical protein